MNTTPITRIGAAATCLALLFLHGAGAHADGGPKITELFKAPLEGSDGREVIVSHVAYPPAFASPAHYHTGDVVVYVLGGEGAMVVDGDTRSGGPGDIIEEAAGRTMTMHNESTEDWLRFVVFQVGPEGEPMIVLQE